MLGMYARIEDHDIAIYLHRFLGLPQGSATSLAICLCILQNKGNSPLRVARGWGYSPSAYLLTDLVEFKKLRI